MNANLKSCLKLIGLFVLVMLAMIFIAAALSSCNPAARLARKQAQAVSTVFANNDLVNTVGVEWSKNHPCANDTTIFNISSDTNVVYHNDTMVLTVKVHDTVFTTKTIYEQTVKTIRDTTKNYIVDTRAVNSLTDSLNNYRQLEAASDGQILQISNVSSVYQSSANHWKWEAYITWILLVIGVIIGVVIKLKKV